MTYKLFLLRWTEDCTELYFIVLQNQTEKEKSGKAAIKYLVILSHIQEKGETPFLRRKEKLLRKNSSGLEASQAKPVFQNNTSFHRIISRSGFTLALLLLGDLDNSIPISIFSLVCEKKKENNSLPHKDVVRFMVAKWQTDPNCHDMQ